MKKIMIVEDDLVLQRMYVNALTHEGYEVVTASDASQVMTKLTGGAPDLMLLDIMLSGGKNGFDILESLKADPNYRKIPVIVCTNIDSEKDTAIEIGAIDYFIKSNTPVADLVAKINHVLNPETVTA
jgi:CheY-like chemotaxis protein